MAFLREDLVTALAAFTVMLVIVLVAFQFVDKKALAGPAVFVFGFLPLIPVLAAGRTIKSIAADVIYGIVDGGILGAFAIAGASVAGVIGAVFGGAAGNALSDGFGGLWEGVAATWLRRHGIKEARTPLSSSMGKMSGVAIGAGIALMIGWNLLAL